MSKVNTYKHLNINDKIPFSITDTVKNVIALNYGAQRFLSEIVEQRENSIDYQKYSEFREHTEQLRNLLDSGWY